MDRRGHLEQLDAIRPDSDDLSRAEFAEARLALRTDSELAEEFEARRVLDRQIVVALHDVPVPAGLAARLRERIVAEDSADTMPAPQGPAGRSSRLSRRGFLEGLVALTVCLVVGIIVWAERGNALEPLSVAAVERVAGQLLRGELQAAPFSGLFEPVLPTGRWRRLRFTSPALGLFPTDEGCRAAAWRFRLGTLRGVLVAVPRETIGVTPDESLGYVVGSTVAWTEGDFVYVCRVNGRIDELLQRLGGRRLA